MLLWVIFQKLKNSSVENFNFTHSVMNKKICLVRIVLFMCMVLYYLFARLLIEKKDLFFLAIGFAVSTPLLRHNRL